jgi:hypothetical protein
MVNGFSPAQQTMLRFKLGIPAGEPIVKHNPHTHHHLPDAESGCFAFDAKVRSGQVWTQDAHRMVNKFRPEQTRRAIVSPTDKPLKLQPHSQLEHQQAGIEHWNPIDLLNFYRQLAGLEPLNEITSSNIRHYSSTGVGFNPSGSDYSSSTFANLLDESTSLDYIDPSGHDEGVLYRPPTEAYDPLLPASQKGVWNSNLTGDLVHDRMATVAAESYRPGVERSEVG